MNITQKLSALAVASLATFGGNLHAQTVLWGAGSGDQTQEDIATFASTDNTLGTTGWTTSGTPAAGVWFWSPDGVSQGFRAPYWNTQGVGEWITSPTISNGCGYFDSDWYDTGGTGAGQGTVPGPHNSTMVSPAIDLTGYTDSILAVKFYLSYLEFQVTDLSVGFSTDGGVTYTDIDYRGVTGGSGVRAWFNDWTTIVFPNVLDGVTDLTDCRIRYTFNGDYYFVAIDDISLLLGSSFDIAFAAPTEAYDFQTVGYPAPHVRMPFDVAESFGPYIFGAMVTNNGGETIPLAANPRVSYDIAKETAPGVWTSVLGATVNFTHDIPPGDTASASGDITTQLQAAYTANGAGAYRILYTLDHDLNEGNVNNDTMELYYWLTDYVYSAMPSDATGGPAANATAFPAAGTASNVIQTFEWGGLYYFPDTTGQALDSVDYRLYVDANHNSAGYPSVVVTVNVYEALDANSDGQIDFATELNLRTLAVDTVVVDNSMKGTHIYRKVKIVDPNNLNPVTFQYDYPYGLWQGANADGLYAITASQTNSNGIIGTAQERNGFFASTYDPAFDWNQNIGGITSFTPMRVVEGLPGATGTENWYSGFTGAFQGPSLALRMYKFPVSVQNVENTTSNAVNLYPNPASNMMNVSVDLDKMSNTVRYMVTDVQGRVLNMQTRNNIQNDVFTMDVSSLPAGVYFVHVKTDNGSFAKRFVKE